jgi:hypothetical protein
MSPSLFGSGIDAVATVTFIVESKMNILFDSYRNKIKTNNMFR